LIADYNKEEKEEGKSSEDARNDITEDKQLIHFDVNSTNLIFFF